MKHFSVLESGIIGFFVGVIASAYILFVDSFGGHIGSILNYVSLRPALSFLQFPGDALQVSHFLFFVVVFIVYAIIIGILIKSSHKIIFYIVPLIILVLAGIFYQQIQGISIRTADQSTDMSAAIYTSVATNHSAKSIKKDEQYFGNEVSGDLNGDGVNDVAFIISRVDADRGTLYYLVSSLATDTGHIGTNLLFLGDKAEPQVISITDGIIDVSYIDHSTKGAPTKHFYAHIREGILDQIIITGKNNGLYWGQVSLEGEVATFKPCTRDDFLPIAASSTLMSKTHDHIMQVASSNGSTLPIFGVLIGSPIENSAKNRASVSSTTPSYKGFLLQSVVTLTTRGVCP